MLNRLHATVTTELHDYYHPAEGWWAQSPHRRALWAIANVEVLLRRVRPREQQLRRWHARLARLLRAIVTDKLLTTAWQARPIIRQASPPEDIPADAWPAIERAIEQVMTSVLAQVRALRADAARMTAREFGLDLPPDLLDRAINEAFDQVRGISDTLRERLRTLMREVMAEERTQFDFARRMRREWDTISRWRAEVIARTEWARVAGMTTLELYQRQETPGKLWLTAGDWRVCAICRANAAQGPIPIDQVFASGHDTVPAHPICRCNIAGSLLTGQ